MQISGFYRVKKHPPHSKRGGCFFMFVKILNLMTLAENGLPFLRKIAVFPQMLALEAVICYTDLDSHRRVKINKGL